MSKYVDCLGREWTLRLTLGHRAALKDLGVDTADLGSTVSTLTQATGGPDIDRLVSVVKLLTVEPIPADYADGWDAGTIDSAGEALVDAVADFYLGRRPKLAAALKQRVRDGMAALDEKAAHLLNGVTLSSSATSSPESSGSTPDPTPSTT